MSKFLEILYNIYDAIGSTSIYIIIIGVLALSNYYFYQKSVDLSNEIATLEYSKETLKQTIEEQNKKISEFKKDVKEYKNITEVKVTEIKQETETKKIEVEKELEKDSSDTNQLKIIDKLLLEFSNAK